MLAAIEVLDYPRAVACVASYLERTRERRKLMEALTISCSKFQNDPNWRENILFHEYFHGDNGAGIGASHQTGWTGLVANLIDEWRR